MTTQETRAYMKKYMRARRKAIREGLPTSQRKPKQQPLHVAAAEIPACASCGEPVDWNPRWPTKIYCSRRCRMRESLKRWRSRHLETFRPYKREYETRYRAEHRELRMTQGRESARRRYRGEADTRAGSICVANNDVCLAAARGKHRHCGCGLPMALDEVLCSMCRAEEEKRALQGSRAA